jgi:hypothetical protein
MNPFLSIVAIDTCTNTITMIAVTATMIAGTDIAEFTTGTTTRIVA